VKPSNSTPARVVIRMEVAAHAAMMRRVAAGDVTAAEGVRRILTGWAGLRSRLAADEPHGAWLN
jgi:hypothetical protein